MRRCLSKLIGDGVDVFVLDHDSTDGSGDIAREFEGRGLVGIERLAWTGTFSLSEQLQAKARIADSRNYDWIIHADADEWLCSSVEGQTLQQGLAAADAQGYNCVNFHEVVFVPLAGEDFFAEDHAERMRSYYFFQPYYPRLIRAWRRDARPSNLLAGGHVLQGTDLRVSPIDFILRHYIVLSEEHARRKYLGRVFAREDLDRGWHGSRLVITEKDLMVKPVAGIMRLPDSEPAAFDLSAPLKTHFWQW